MFTDINYKLADALVRNIGYYTVIKDAPQARVDLICSMLNGEAAFSAVCDVEDGWIYTAATRPKDLARLKIDLLTENIDPWNLQLLHEGGEQPTSEFFDLLSLKEESIELPNGTRPSRTFIGETQRNLTEQLYDMLEKTHRLKDARHDYIPSNLHAKIALHVRKGNDVNKLKVRPRKPNKQVLQQSATLLSTVIYD